MSDPILTTAIEQTIYTEEECRLLDPAHIPRHIAIIMDGNRRWAKGLDYPLEVGHWQGAERLDAIVRAAAALGVQALTAYGFSTENWRRSQKEVDKLMEILETYLVNKRSSLVEEGVRLRAIGDLRKLPPTVIAAFEDTIAATASCTKIDLIIAVNYGGRDEICRGVKRIIEKVECGELCSDDINMELISQHLDTAHWDDPDLVIRTSGESRLSNFLTWQTTYSEIIFTEKLWPDFSEQDLLGAILEFQRRHRRYGE